MAVSVNADALDDKGKSANPETEFIKAGNRLARLVSYVELGVHKQMFQGKPALYEQGKNAGREKPAVLHVAMTFEFPTCKYTGDYPLTISTTRRMDNGDFFDSVTVPASLADGTISKSVAMRTKFMKYLSALQNATGKPWSSIAEFAKHQVALLITVTNKRGKAKEDGSTPVYANMKPEGINATRVEDPVSGEVTDYADKCPEAIGTYCPVFDWDAPTADAWKALKPWDKKTIKAALNFEGSPIAQMLQADPTLDAVQDGSADGNAAEDHSAPVEPTTSTVNPKQEDIPV